MVDINRDDSTPISSQVDELNNDSSIHGILTQLPMPAHIAERNVLRRILVSKDVDGFSARNIGNLALKGGDPYSAASCTPLGIMELLKRSGIEVAGKKAVVLGRSNIVGMPLTLLVRVENLTLFVNDEGDHLCCDERG